MFSDIALLARRLQAEARHTQQRRMLLFAGSRDWAVPAAHQVLQALGGGKTLWISDQAADPRSHTLLASQAHKVLGSELDALVMDAYAGFDPEAFGAAIGSLRGGGLLLLITPLLTQWEDFADPQNARITVAPVPPDKVSGRFLRRLAGIFSTSPAVTLIAQEQPLPPLVPVPIDAPNNPPPTTADRPCRTADQHLAVQALRQLAKGHRHRPLVLISDRGRGKSAALGIAAAQLLADGLQRIIITAPRLAAALPALEHAKRWLPGNEGGIGELRGPGIDFRFVPPDALMQEQHAADLLLVDEAAALPTPWLENLLSRYARIAFATTVHGYEGSGRGFALRFRRILDRQTPQWRQLRLEQPIRWAANDPLEHLTFRALLLDAAPVSDAAVAACTATDCEFVNLTRTNLLEDEAWLRQLFGLLVLAHYRTSPLDLRHLLDGPNISVVALEQGQKLLAVALLADEGGFDVADSTRIFLGQRRFHGHLLPQSLSQHLGIEQAPRLRCRRVLRIAVHPALQGRGFGSRLLAQIGVRALADGLDYIGASFGADTPLLHFWRRGKYLPVRLGVSRDAASGAHSATVLQPLSALGQRLFDSARRRFAQQFPQMLGDSLRDLEPGLALALMRVCPSADFPALSRADWRDLMALAFAARAYEVTPAATGRLVRYALSDASALRLLEPSQQTLLLCRVMQRQTWAIAARRSGCAGRKPALAMLRQSVGRLLEYYADNAVRRDLRQLRRALATAGIEKSTRLSYDVNDAPEPKTEYKKKETET